MCVCVCVCVCVCNVCIVYCGPTILNLTAFDVVIDNVYLMHVRFNTM